MRVILAVMVAISAGAFFWIVGSTPDEIRPLDLAILGGIAVIVLILQVGVVAILCQLTNRMVAIVAASILTGLNIYYFAAVATQGSLAIKLVVPAVAGLFVAVALWRRSGAGILILFASVFSVISFAQYTFGRISLEVEAAPHIEPMDVASKRNVYLISFESLNSPAAFRELYGVDDPYVSALKNLGFRVLDNAYSANVATKASYERILEFAAPLKTTVARVNVFRRDNSTFRSFRDSGYELEFMYRNNYFDINPKSVDHLYPPAGFYLCDNLPSDFMYLACRKPVTDLINSAIYKTGAVISIADQVRQLRNRVDVVANSGTPWLTVNHIAHPFHTRTRTYRYDRPEMTAAFIEKMRNNLPLLSEVIKQTLGYIVARDPNAVVISFGDHGAGLSRGMNDKRPTANSFFSLHDYLLDRHGVMLAVYPKDFCIHRIFEGSATTHLVPNLIKCLNGDDKPKADEIVDARMIYFGGHQYIDASTIH